MVDPHSIVIAGLSPAIHHFRQMLFGMDARIQASGSDAVLNGQARA
jgi:hypothetical protein